MRCSAIAGLFFVFIVPAQADTTGRATVDDGDTIEIRGRRHDQPWLAVNHVFERPGRPWGTCPTAKWHRKNTILRLRRLCIEDFEVQGYQRIE